MKILKYTPPEQTHKKDCYFYMATAGKHPNASEKGVMFSNVKFSNIQTYNRRKEVYEFLGSDPSNITIFRIDQTGVEDWVEVTARENDYCVGFLNKTVELVNQLAPKLLNSELWREAVQHVYGVNTYTFRYLNSPFTNNVVNGEKYREIRFEHVGLVNIKHLVRRIHDANFQVETITLQEAKAIGFTPTMTNGRTEYAIETQSKAFAKISFDGRKPIICLNKGLAQVNNPMWRVKKCGEGEWHYFYAVNLGSTTAFGEVLKRLDIAPIANLINDAQYPSLKELFGNKYSYPEVEAIIDQLEIEVLSIEGEWEAIDAISHQQSSTSLSRNDFSSSSMAKMKKSIEEHYGYPSLYTLICAPISHLARLARTAKEFDVFMHWCEKVSPEFITNTINKPKRVGAASRAKSYEIIGYEQTTNGISDAQKLFRQEMAIESFVQQWNKLHELLNVDAPSMNISAFHNASNRRRSFYIKPEESGVFVEANSGFIINLVGDEEDKKGNKTIHYVNPKLSIDARFNMRDFLLLQAAEVLADYISNNIDLYSNAISKILDRNTSQWKSQTAQSIVNLLV
ncbi:hypothetical protein [Vibrio coralliilyticus]|uniref:hypothetical protein n=1 Tax=Vibrio coralliilyticus TaxID=190893 RepID=UPI001E331C56|nr:hypothetical protein [Vibrio coralliilyticus]MCC2525021.1 hypothetical protein [Vibrio coralliilyticus]